MQTLVYFILLYMCIVIMCVCMCACAGAHEYIDKILYILGVSGDGDL